MPFDPNLDKTMFSKEKMLGKTRISVQVKQYNEGDKKIQITRENQVKSGEFKFAKLGRLNKEEAEAVMPMLKNALEHL